ncbi:MAG: YdcF family protein [Acidobacteriia bacterium]|nr:YdcF family protein [Terriglobia bacterium]
MSILDAVSNVLIANEVPGPCDLIFVLAGRPERKDYGLELFQRGLAPRLILSVGRFEVRQTAAAFELPELISMRDKTQPFQRHFWMDFTKGSRQVRLAGLKRHNTFWELSALAGYLAPEPPRSIALVSTSIHLRRIRFCCRRIPFFQERTVFFLAVPEEASSFQRDTWWKRKGHWSYVAQEYVKLAGYHLLY